MSPRVQPDPTASTHWDPTLYLKFSDQRLRPALDLLDRVRVESPETIYDLGCGSGNATRMIAQRWPSASVYGVDSSREMLEQADPNDKAAHELLGHREFTYDVPEEISFRKYPFVRAVEEAIRTRQDSPPAKTEVASAAADPGGRLRAPGLMELEELLGDYLETRVRITMGARHGRVLIEFANLEDLERIYRAMSQGPAGVA